MKMQFLLSFLLAWLCVGMSAVSESSGGITGDNFEVKISGLMVKITCPAGATKLTKKGKQGELSTGGNYTKDNFSADDNGEYDCDNKRLYLQAYVCENCIEVSVLLVAGILIADCLVTLGVALFIYFGWKRKSARSSEMAPAGRNRGNKERPPPVPHPDYEPLQKRGQVVYDGLNKNFK
ncbi:T-cell surface glycoprotein CD3 epsilon chain [Aquarana catesbeiana]|uniref:T-cell surface glycoprotein CD3 epsilon chain n=1 Tax=Aquarana catesbeiana TaxID=8400 RepID=UPI003CCA0DB0